jgi:hypothetical protein
VPRIFTVTRSNAEELKLKGVTAAVGAVPSPKMPLYTSKEQWDAWVESVRRPYTSTRNGKKQTRYSPGVAGEPKSYPCYCLYEYYSGDCSDDMYECTFVYPKQIIGEEIVWDLETFEREEF